MYHFGNYYPYPAPYPAPYPDYFQYGQYGYQTSNIYPYITSNVSLYTPQYYPDATTRLSLMLQMNGIQPQQSIQNEQVTPILELDDKEPLEEVNPSEFNKLDTNHEFTETEIEDILNNIDEEQIEKTDDKKFEPFFKESSILDESLNETVKSTSKTISMYCINCGKHNHLYKDCLDPVKSYGLICFYPSLISPESYTKGKKTKKNLSEKIQKDKTLSKFDPQQHEIKTSDTHYSYKIIMVQRKNTIGIVEFIRGKYDITMPLDDLKKYLIKLFDMTTFEEKHKLETYDNFDEIRNNLGLSRHYYFRNEYDESKKKFEYVKSLNFGQQGNGIQQLLKLSLITRTTPEWGLPKGRKNNSELEVDCAIREFIEETGIDEKYIKIYKNVKPLREIYKGVNNIVYEHIYYIATLDTSTDISEYITTIIGPVKESYEISNVQLMTQRESISCLREYHTSKKQAIEKGFQIISNLPYYFE
jgi:hypothetical protein